MDELAINSELLTREKQLRRRLHRVKQLARCFRSQYSALVHEVESNYMEYYWTYGKSPFEDDQENNGPKDNVNNSNGNRKVTEDSDGGLGDDLVQSQKVMALTKDCGNHILADSKEEFDRSCNVVIKNLPTGPSRCSKPVPRSMILPVCLAHYQLGKKSLIHAIRRAGYAIPPNHKLNPKFHVLVTEFVRQIQIKRKAALKKTGPKAEIK